MLKRHRLDTPIDDGCAVERVEPLKTCADVGGAIRVVPVEDALARQFDLIGRVVRMEPRRGPIAQADLEQCCGDEQREHDADGGDDQQHATQWFAPGQHDREHGSEDASEQCRCTHDSKIPVAIGGPYQWSEQPIRRGGGCDERPGVTAEPRHGDQHEANQHAEERESAVVPHAMLPLNTGLSSSSRTSGSRPAPDASRAATTHIAGSAKKLS